MLQSHFKRNIRNTQPQEKWTRHNSHKVFIYVYACSCVYVCKLMWNEENLFFGSLLWCTTLWFVVIENASEASIMHVQWNSCHIALKLNTHGIIKWTRDKLKRTKIKTKTTITKTTKSRRDESQMDREFIENLIFSFFYMKQSVDILENVTFDGGNRTVIVSSNILRFIFVSLAGESISYKYWCFSETQNRCFYTGQLFAMRTFPII